ncbi:uncharacterized protein DNG_07514 [Cephalotrichum gorgonifer]|uniref:lytic cellulose monooxygenase (C4-dehydrogenating) n=1 Tax=Cephalotrichum gorgonifer TaxID=2041049 RepID=A0AAE8SXJ8_9PEZI|nr:uncharacterized protein DNG_07514 [Cephalotrichum gorgonifer]
MRGGVCFVVGAGAVLPRALGHYCFHRLVTNGTETEPWQYVRNVTAGPATYTIPNLPLYQENPMLDVNSENMRCGRNATISGRGSDVATVVAGGTVGFLSSSMIGRDFYHPGPGLAYLSKSPLGTDVRDYDGSGEWFKIEEVGLNLTLAGEPGHEHDAQWMLQGLHEFVIRIPESTPPGEYLLRAEQIYPWAKWNETQFFVNCAQINILGPGGGRYPWADCKVSRGLFE